MPAATLDQVAPLPTVDILDREICRVGTWNGRPYTQAELAEAVAVAHELGSSFAIPLKFGHDPEQRLLQQDGFPAAGWVQNLRLRGETLIGDYCKVPARLAQLIKAGAYRTQSAEFLLNTEVAGKLRRFMLSAVALLGADLPAVDSLADIANLYNARAMVALAADAPEHACVELAAQAPVADTPHTSEAAMPFALTPSLALALLKLPDAVADAYLAWRVAHPALTTLVAGPTADDVQSAVLAALAQTYPPARAEDDDASAPAQDGPSCNVLDWYLSGAETSVIVSDQDIDNLWEIPFTYDAASDRANLGQPVAVKGTYTPNTSGTESGAESEAGAESDPTDAPPPAADGSDADMAAMSRQLAESLETVHGLAALAPNETAVTTLSAALSGQAMVLALAASAGDPQKAVQKILAALDQALTDMGTTASGRPGMGFIRTTLSEVKRKLAAMKFPAPKPAVAANRREGVTDVDLPTLARKLGLPETASEAEIDAVLSQRQAPAALLTRMAADVTELRQERAQGRIDALIAGAITEAKIRKDSDLEKQLRTLAQHDFTTATAIVGGLRPSVDLAEHGRTGDDPQAPEVAGEIARLARKFGADPAPFQGRRPLNERWKQQLAAKEAAQLARFSPTTAGART